MAHHVDFIFIDPVSIKEMVAGGRLKALAITSAKSIAALPGLPGAAEVGIKNMDLISWWSVHVPAKTPQPIIDKLTMWFNQIAASDDAKRFLSNLGADPLLGSADLVDKMIAKETQEWNEYVKIAKIEPQ
jgi:tripartite-type tricarboxylate transporter receptor subunit TctC